MMQLAQARAQQLDITTTASFTLARCGSWREILEERTRLPARCDTSRPSRPAGFYFRASAQRQRSLRLHELLAPRLLCNALPYLFNVSIHAQCPAANARGAHSAPDLLLRDAV